MPRGGHPSDRTLLSWACLLYVSPSLSQKYLPTCSPVVCFFAPCSRPLAPHCIAARAISLCTPHPTSCCPTLPRHHGHLPTHTPILHQASLLCLTAAAIPHHAAPLQHAAVGIPCRAPTPRSLVAAMACTTPPGEGCCRLGQCLPGSGEDTVTGRNPCCKLLFLMFHLFSTYQLQVFYVDFVYIL
jgi:hypothetical protein